MLARTAEGFFPLVSLPGGALCRFARFGSCAKRVIGPAYLLCLIYETVDPRQKFYMVCRNKYRVLYKTVRGKSMGENIFANSTMLFFMKEKKEHFLGTTDFINSSVSVCTYVVL